MGWWERTGELVDQLRRGDGSRDADRSRRQAAGTPERIADVRPGHSRAARHTSNRVRIGSNKLYIDTDRVPGPVSARINRYLDGEPVAFDADIDLSDRTPFQQDVLNAIRDVPYGDTITYSGLAERIDRPDAARAVANACGANPCPIVVSKRGLGGYSDGVSVKARLLALER